MQQKMLYTQEVPCTHTEVNNHFATMKTRTSHKLCSFEVLNVTCRIPHYKCLLHISMAKTIHLFAFNSY